MTPLERATQAILTGQFEYLGCPDENPDCSGGISCPKNAKEAARAVLTAIREPSEAMLAKGGHNGPWDAFAAPDEKDNARDVYLAMIDALLEEGS